MTPLSSETLHATCVAIDGIGVLIEGPSGAGKSDLALRLIDRGAVLVSDDYTIVQRRGGALSATAPATISGIMEVRGLGILPFPIVASAPVGLVVTLATDTDRLPLDQPSRPLLGVTVPIVSLDPRPASAPIKVELAARRAIAYATGKGAAA